MLTAGAGSGCTLRRALGSSAVSRASCRSKTRCASLDSGTGPWAERGAQDLAHAIASVKHGAAVAQQHRKALPLTSRIAGLVLGSSGVSHVRAMSAVQRHAELVYAECLLEKAVVGIVYSGDWLQFIKEACVRPPFGESRADAAQAEHAHGDGHLPHAARVPPRAGRRRARRIRRERRPALPQRHHARHGPVRVLVRVVARSADSAQDVARAEPHARPRAHHHGALRLQGRPHRRPSAPHLGGTFADAPRRHWRRS